MRARDPAYKKISPIAFAKLLKEKAGALRMDPALIERAVNQGFSGGEKKKAEILQLQVLQPLLALLDETDSGLDVDALRSVAEGLNAMRLPSAPSGDTKVQRTKKGHPFSALLVTHYARILEYVVPDRVHVMVRGKIVKSGGAAFARQLEKEGYGKYAEGEEPAAGLRLDIEE